MKVLVKKPLLSIKNGTIEKGVYYLFIWNEDHPHWAASTADTSDSIKNSIIFSSSFDIQYNHGIRLLSIISFKKSLKEGDFVILDES